MQLQPLPSKEEAYKAIKDALDGLILDTKRAPIEELFIVQPGQGPCVICLILETYATRPKVLYLSLYVLSNLADSEGSKLPIQSVAGTEIYLVDLKDPGIIYGQAIVDYEGMVFFGDIPNVPECYFKVV